MWAQVGPLLPPLKGRDGQAESAVSADGRRGERPAADGMAWRDLPAEFGPWQTVWKRRYETAGHCHRTIVSRLVAADHDVVELNLAHVKAVRAQQGSRLKTDLRDAAGTW